MSNCDAPAGEYDCLCSIVNVINNLSSQNSKVDKWTTCTRDESSYAVTQRIFFRNLNISI